MHTVKMGLRPPQRYSEKTDLEFTCMWLARFDTCYKIREGQRTGELQPLLVDKPFRIYHAKGVWSCKWQLVIELQQRVRRKSSWERCMIRHTEFDQQPAARRRKESV